jgi:hypothetical protein
MLVPDANQAGAAGVGYHLWQTNTILGKSNLPNYISGLVDNLEYVELSHADRWKLSSAWERAKPRLEPKLDLLVFLAEIAELPALVKSLGGKLKRILSLDGSDVKRAYETLNGLAHSIVRSDAAQPGFVKLMFDNSRRLVSKEWLEYNFALKPTVSDLIGIVEAILDFRAALEELKKGAGKPQKTHVSYEWTDEVDPVVVEEQACTYCETGGGLIHQACLFASHRGNDRNIDDHVPGPYFRHVYVGGRVTRIGLTVRYHYTLPDWVDESLASVHALCAALGVNPGLGTIWELIPFSFVLDWAWNFGAMLDRVRFDAVPVITTVTDMCWSKRVIEGVLLQGRQHICPLTPISTYYSGDMETYHRIVGSEPLTWIPSLTWPSWMQLSLGMALLQ